MLQSISESTLKQHCKPLVEWASFCRDSNSDVFYPKTETVVTWLNLKYSKGASFGTLNTCRAALSLIIGEKIGKNPAISRLLKGVYNVKPAKPKYDRTYDLDPVLVKLEALYPLEGLSLIDLTNKLLVY